MNSNITYLKKESKEYNASNRNRSTANKDSDDENEYRTDDGRRIMMKCSYNSLQPGTETSKFSKSPLREPNKTLKPKFQASNVPFRHVSSQFVESDVAMNLTPSRKSVEENSSSTKPTNANLNSSHPPWIKPMSSISKNSSAKFNMPSATPGTPKVVVRTPRNTPNKGSAAPSSTNIRKSVSRLGASVESKGTPVSTRITAESYNTPNRKSGAGSTQKCDFITTLKRSSSTRKSVVEMFPPANTRINTGSSRKKSPSHFNHRVSSQGLLLTPTQQIDLASTSSNAYDMERWYDESSSTVSVGVRVRPISKRELQNPNVCNIVTIDGNEVTVKNENGNCHTFAYDHCFNSFNQHHRNYASQKHVYESMARPLLFHAYEGYNVCLFAYGQTGSGKSYCIMGENNGRCKNGRREESLSDGDGIIPRFCRELFEEADNIHGRNNGKEIQCQVVIEIGYIEIYNEKIYDLVGHNISVAEDEQRPIGDKRDALRIREHPQHGPYVEDASFHLVTSYSDLETWINLGNKQRSIAATAMNDTSSRSHSVFTIKVTQTKSEEIQGEVMEHSLVSVINLVDLAGSERVAASSSEGDRLKEGVCINKSLLTLGKVITALAESCGRRKTFIPYRESALTWLLKESLGGNSKTAMIATISPCNFHQEESLSTLRYAQQARKIVNWNRINEDPTSKIIRALKLEVERLRALQLFSPKVPSVEDEEEDILPTKSPEEEKRKEKTDQQSMREREIIHLKEIEISLLKEKLRTTQEQLTEKAKVWEDRVRQEEEKKEEALERCRLRGLALKIEGNQPTLVNLCEDPQLSQTLLYNLKHGATSLGKSNSDVTLSALHDSEHHCSILYEGKRLVLHPKKESETYINGKLITMPTQVFHNDRIILSGIYFFRVCFPTGGTSSSESATDKGNKFDFHYAKDELLKHQEVRIRREMDLQQERSRDDMLRRLEEQCFELHLQEKALKENVQVLSTELEEERFHNQENEMAKLMLEEEKNHLEHQVKTLKNLTLRSSSQGHAQSTSPNEDDSFFRNMETIFNESIQRLETSKPEVEKGDLEIWFLISEANNICSKLKKPYKFQQELRLTSQGFQNTNVIHDYEHNLCAFLDGNQFKRVLNILRDLIRNEEADNDLLETSIPWERSDEVSKVPLIQNKIKENAHKLSLSHALNTSLSSMNLSLNNKESLGAMNSRRSSRRRSVLNQTLLKNVPDVTNHSIIVAKAVSDVLLNQAASANDNCTLFTELVTNLLKLHNMLKKFGDYFPETSLADEEKDLTKEMIEISVLVTVIKQSLIFLSRTPIENITGKAVDVQANLSSHGITLLRKVARMMQGVEKEVDSLVEKETSSLLSLIYELVEDLGFLNLVSCTEMPEEASLISSLTFGGSFLAGVSKGLEWGLKRAAETAEKRILIGLVALSQGFKDSSRSQFIQSAQMMVESISKFLTQFSRLKVIPSIEPTKSAKNAEKETKSFLVRVFTAFMYIDELFLALKSIYQEVQNIYKGSDHLFILQDNLTLLQETLKALVDDAGIGGNYGKRRAINKRLEEGSDMDGDDAVLDKLYLLATRAFKDLTNLRVCLTNLNSEIALQRKLSFQEPLKSSFKSELKSEEKKVRFNVSFTSTLSNSFLDEDEQFDTIDV